MTGSQLRTWFWDKFFPPFAVTAALALLVWIVGLLAVPGKVQSIEATVTTVQKDVGNLREAKGSLETAAKNAEAKVTSLDEAAKKFTAETSKQVLDLEKTATRLDVKVKELSQLTAKLETLRKSIDGLSTTVAKLDATVKRMDGRAGVVASRESTLQVSLTDKEAVERGDNVWEFRTPVPKDLNVIRIVRAEPVGWPPIFNGLAADAVLDGPRVRLFMRGNTAPIRAHLTRRPLMLRIVLAVK